eukprot:TRINITY_DN471_c0_g1_i1.p1 TRINITY_DN471_c0_g1~~TRINITY_DN471_c0_g1_i1.p1  ORF type:complete len:747 (-),score=175.49 TRINITY_DN471_c0_g1_i1:3057-5297(-)
MRILLLTSVLAAALHVGLAFTATTLSGLCSTTTITPVSAFTEGVYTYMFVVDGGLSYNTAATACSTLIPGVSTRMASYRSATIQSGLETAANAVAHMYIGYFFNTTTQAAQWVDPTNTYAGVTPLVPFNNQNPCLEFNVLNANYPVHSCNNNFANTAVACEVLSSACSTPTAAPVASPTTASTPAPTSTAGGGSSGGQSGGGTVAPTSAAGGSGGSLPPTPTPTNAINTTQIQVQTGTMTAGQTSGISAASLILVVGALTNAYVLSNPRSIEKFYALSSSYFVMLVDVAQFFALTTVFNVNLDQIYTQFSAGFLWTDAILRQAMRNVWTTDSSYQGAAVGLLSTVDVGPSQVMGSLLVVYAVAVGVPLAIIGLEWFCKFHSNQRVHWMCIGIISRTHHILGYAIPFAAGFELMNGSVLLMKVVAFLLLATEIGFGFLLWLRAGVKANDPTQTLSLADVADRMQYGYFFIGLKNDKRYFFLLDYYRRVLVGGILAILLVSPAGQLVAVSLVEFGYFLFLKSSKPMVDITLQSTQEYSSFVRGGAPLVALLALHSITGTMNGISMAISVLLLLLFCGIFIVILISLVRVAMGASELLKEVHNDQVDLATEAPKRSEKAAFLKDSRDQLLKKSFDPVKENDLPESQDRSRDKLHASVQSVGSDGSNKKGAKKVMMIEEDDNESVKTLNMTGSGGVVAPALAGIDEQEPPEEPQEDPEMPAERNSMASTVMSGSSNLGLIKAKPKANKKR